MFTLICARINGWLNNREAGDLTRHRAHYNVIVMINVLHGTWRFGVNHAIHRPMSRKLFSVSTSSSWIWDTLLLELALQLPRKHDNWLSKSLQNNKIPNSTVTTHVEMYRINGYPNIELRNIEKRAKFQYSYKSLSGIWSESRVEPGSVSYSVRYD